MSRIGRCLALSLSLAVLLFVVSPPARACDIVLEQFVGQESCVAVVDSGLVVVRAACHSARSVVVARSGFFGQVVLLDERAAVVRRQRSFRVRAFARPRVFRGAIVVR
jgi:hypothetical protein